MQERFYGDAFCLFQKWRERFSGRVAAKEIFVEVRDLHKSFGTQKVLKGVTAKVYKGETLVLLGGSGGGKSVLMKHFIGLMAPDSGEVIVEGENISGMSERELGKIRRKMGMMFQNSALFDSMTVGQNIAFPLRMGGEKDEQRIERLVDESLEIVRLPGQMGKMPSDLSGGMRKRVALARAIVDRPACVLFDEPHAGLDPITADSIDHLVKDLQANHEMTNVIVTHEMRSVFRIADRVMFLKEGQLYWEGTPEELKAATDPELKNFIEGRSGEDWDA
ncbi:ABC transporter ATP-binding protein [Rubritalea tangerina]|uniref:ABC transporter ATP-binding protein n=1 Tax=Rubritalea tangerina TaxID=430798 RepID=UPI00361C3F17